VLGGVTDRSVKKGGKMKQIREINIGVFASLSDENVKQIFRCIAEKHFVGVRDHAKDSVVFCLMMKCGVIHCHGARMERVETYKENALILVSCCRSKVNKRSPEI
jgi:hypothetical protein